MSGFEITWRVKVNVIDCTGTLDLDAITVNDGINIYDTSELSQQTGVDATIPEFFVHSLYQTDTNDT